MLGQLLSDLRCGADLMETLEGGLDLVLLTRVRHAAAVSGSDLTEVVRDAIDGFTGQASDEDWVRLIGRLQDGRPAGPACLDVMLRWWLARAGEEDHGSNAASRA